MDRGLWVLSPLPPEQGFEYLALPLQGLALPIQGLALPLQGLTLLLEHLALLPEQGFEYLALPLQGLTLPLQGLALPLEHLALLPERRHGLGVSFGVVPFTFGAFARHGPDAPGDYRNLCGSHQQGNRGLDLLHRKR